MRSVVVALAAWLGAVAALAQAEDRPIPQDPALIKQRTQDWLAWHRATLGDAYDRVGKRDPKWDKPAREALDRAARQFSYQTDPFISDDDVWQPVQQAVQAGCDDPLILYLQSQFATGKNRHSAAESARRVRSAADAMMASNYPPFRRANALFMALLLKVNAFAQNPVNDDTRAIEAGFDQFLDLLPQSVSTDPRGLCWDQRWNDLLWNALRAMQRVNDDDKQVYDHFDAKLAKVPGIEALRLSLRGEFFKEYAWQARSDQMAAFVTPGQFASFEKRLGESRRVLEAAYKLNPRQPHVARTMLEVLKGIGTDDDRPTMELWFTRAMEVDPFDMNACWNKLDWLDPKWHGDADGAEMLEFGRACAATHNWYTGINLLGGDALLRQYSRDVRAEGGIFLNRRDRWDLIKEVNEEYLKHYPDNAEVLTKYAFMSFWAARIELSHTLFERLGDRLTTWTYQPIVDMKSLLRTREIAANYAADIKAGRVPAKPK